jgi:hypothetical protein
LKDSSKKDNYLIEKYSKRQKYYSPQQVRESPKLQDETFLDILNPLDNYCTGCILRYLNQEVFQAVYPSKLSNCATSQLCCLIAKETNRLYPLDTEDLLILAL